MEREKAPGTAGQYHHSTTPPFHPVPYGQGPRGTRLSLSLSSPLISVPWGLTTLTSKVPAALRQDDVALVLVSSSPRP